MQNRICTNTHLKIFKNLLLHAEICIICFNIHNTKYAIICKLKHATDILLVAPGLCLLCIYMQFIYMQKRIMQKYLRYVTKCKICKNMYPPLCWCVEAQQLLCFSAIIRPGQHCSYAIYNHLFAYHDVFDAYLQCLFIHISCIFSHTCAKETYWRGNCILIHISAYLLNILHILIHIFLLTMQFKICFWEVRNFYNYKQILSSSFIVSNPRALVMPSNLAGRSWASLTVHAIGNNQ